MNKNNEEMIFTGSRSYAEGVESRAIPTGKCMNAVSEELKKEIEKDPINPIKKCVFHKGNDDCYFAGECENKKSLEEVKLERLRQIKFDEEDYKNGIYALTLDDALASAKEGHFVTNSYFSSDQSMHYWNGKFYYEDGAVVTKEFLKKQQFAIKGGWAICISKHRVDKERLNKVHIDSNGMMLYTKAGYQQCVLK